MHAESRTISVKELVENFKNYNDRSIVAYDGELTIVSPYLPKFTYKDNQRDAIIRLFKEGVSVGSFYWIVNDRSYYTVLSRPQYLLAICEYTNNDFSVDGMYFHNLTNKQQQRILKYTFNVYIYDSFEYIFDGVEVDGKELNKQEMYNIIYAGPWVVDAKKYFSKRNCPAYKIGKNYLKGHYSRQDFLETAIKWRSEDKIEKYMELHKSNLSAEPLWEYFKHVIEWVEKTFPPKYNKDRIKLMKQVNWGRLFNYYRDDEFNSEQLEKKIKELLVNKDFEYKPGIYGHVLGEDIAYTGLMGNLLQDAMLQWCDETGFFINKKGGK